MRIILASASPRRRELLRQIGLEFEVRVSDAQEDIADAEPGRVVEQLSARKAEAVSGTLSEDGSEGETRLIIGADTVVVCDGRILGKPADREDACAMLRKLQGRAHQVYTGVTVLARGGRLDGEVRKVFHERTTVLFYPMTEREIQEYVDTGEPMDKAGSYGIQGIFARYIKGIEGDYSNVVGLPVGRLYQECRSLLEEKED